jgi:hypothetical protein
MANRLGTAKRVSGQGSSGAVEAERRGDVQREELRPAAEESPQKSTIEDEIRLRAYYRYLERENEPGDEMSDWLEAESHVLGRRATGVDAEEKVRDDTGLQTQERD